jgi:peptide subunit release factor 1 (eRF1)
MNKVTLDSKAIAYCENCNVRIKTTMRKLKNKWNICMKCNTPMKVKVIKDAVPSVHATD